MRKKTVNLRFFLVLWFCFCILGCNFLPVALADEVKGGGASAQAGGKKAFAADLELKPPALLDSGQARQALAEAQEAQKKAREAQAASAAAQPAGGVLEVPAGRQANSGFKSFMDYRALQNRRSGQYILQQDAATDEQGFRIYDGCYMVALGTYYARGVGERFRITLEGGESFMAITGDIKSDAHTDPKHQHRNGNIVEFIVDTSRISAKCRRMGDMSYAGFAGRIQSIEKIG